MKKLMFIFLLLLIATTCLGQYSPYIGGVSGAWVLAQISDSTLWVRDGANIYYDAGKVGIGITPAVGFHAAGTGNFQVRLQDLDSDGSAAWVQLQFYDQDDQLGYIGYASTSSSLFNIRNIQAGDIAFITANGNFGFNTSAPDGTVEINLGTSGSFRGSYNDSNGSADDHFDITIAADGATTIATTDADSDEADFIVKPDGDMFVDAGFNYGLDTSSVDDDYGVSIPEITAYREGLLIIVEFSLDNTGACTMRINALAQVNIKTQSGDDPENNWIDENSTGMLIYDGTNFVLQFYDANP